MGHGAIRVGLYCALKAGYGFVVVIAKTPEQPTVKPHLRFR
jgi:hypothetical protein